MVLLIIVRFTSVFVCLFVCSCLYLLVVVVMTIIIMVTWLIHCLTVESLNGCLKFVYCTFSRVASPAVIKPAAAERCNLLH